MSQAEQRSQEVKGTTAETTVTAQLREKIKSKMDVAKFFAGFISLLIGILLKEGVALEFPMVPRRDRTPCRLARILCCCRVRL